MLELFWSIIDYQVYGSSTVGNCLCILAILMFVCKLARQKETYEQIVKREWAISNRKK